MKKVRKDRVVMAVAALVILIAIIAIIIINPFKQGDKSKEQTIVPLPSTTYSDMQVTNVEMEYLAENDETMVSMVINNTTEKVVEESKFDTIWIDEADQIIGRLETYVNTLQPGEQCNVSVILKGDLTKTAVVKLQEK